MNPGVVPMLAEALARPGLRAIVLTNAMQPMRRYAAALLALKTRFGDRPADHARQPRPLRCGAS